MASVCELCGKKPSFGMNVSHSHRRTKRRWNPNIQRVRALVGGDAQAHQRLHRVPALGQGHQARPRRSAPRALEAVLEPRRSRGSA
jgi:large subunit ribosomal protein L28